MPQMGPLIPEIAHVKPVYDPLRFKTLEWALSQTWNVRCMTRIGLMFGFNPLSMERPFSCLKFLADQLSDMKSILLGLGQTLY